MIEGVLINPKNYPGIKQRLYQLTGHELNDFMFKTCMFIIVVLLTAIVAGCGTEQCINGPVNLSFVSFPATATDTIVLKQYFKNATFDSLLQSTTFTKATGSYNQAGDTLSVGQAYLDANYDYTIFLPAVNRLLKISHITVEQREVHLGFSTYKTECLNPIKSYTLNGQVISTNSYILYLHN